jgi:DNA topoisomerase-2
MSLSKTYRKHTHREHILSLPDTYVGSIENSTEEHYVVEADKFILKTLNFNSGFYKLIDELLVIYWLKPTVISSKMVRSFMN